MTLVWARIHAAINNLDRGEDDNTAKATISTTQHIFLYPSEGEARLAKDLFGGIVILLDVETLKGQSRHGDNDIMMSGDPIEGNDTTAIIQVECSYTWKGAPEDGGTAEFGKNEEFVTKLWNLGFNWSL